jgi:hypothetical protein
VKSCLKEKKKKKKKKRKPERLQVGHTPEASLFHFPIPLHQTVFPGQCRNCICDPVNIDEVLGTSWRREEEEDDFNLGPKNGVGSG